LKIKLQVAKGNDMSDGRSLDTRTNRFLKDYPPETHSWQGKATLGLGYPIDGWIVLTVTCTTYLQGVIIYCSHGLDPFPDFIRWLDSIALGQLPAEISVDEEGTAKIFRASSANAEEIVFEILDRNFDNDQPAGRPIFLYVQVAKKQFLAEFLKRWDDFIANQFDQAQWEFGADLRELDVSKIREFVHR
jgi:hypothetical protein